MRPRIHLLSFLECRTLCIVTLKKLVEIASIVSLNALVIVKVGHVFAEIIQIVRNDPLILIISRFQKSVLVF